LHGEREFEIEGVDGTDIDELLVNIFEFITDEFLSSFDVLAPLECEAVLGALPLADPGDTPDDHQEGEGATDKVAIEVGFLHDTGDQTDDQGEGEVHDVLTHPGEVDGDVLTEVVDEGELVVGEGAARVEDRGELTPLVDFVVGLVSLVVDGEVVEEEGTSFLHLVELETTTTEGPAFAKHAEGETHLLRDFDAETP